MDGAVAMRGRKPLSMRCPDCGSRMQRARKGWACPDPSCPVTRVRGNPMKGRIDRVEREARRRVTPLTDMDLKNMQYMEG